MTKPLRILLVDDRPEVLQAYQMALSEFNFETVSATRGTEALLHAAQQHFNLIILDIDMPGMNGFEVCRNLKQDPKTCEIPVIFVTGRTGTTNETLGLSLGAVGYLTKPFGLEVLKNAVQSWAIAD